MTEDVKLKVINMSWKLHSEVEMSYLNHSAKQGSTEWLEKQSILLADMSLHLLQTAISPDDMNLDRLRDNLYSILTITDQFLPNAGLKKAAKDIYKST